MYINTNLPLNNSVDIEINFLLWVDTSPNLKPTKFSNDYNDL